MDVATHTLGCKLNFAETSHLQRKFSDAGFNIVSYKEKADLYIINTCTVTAVAEKKCRNAIRQARSQNPSAVIAVIGCFAQNGEQQVAAIPGVDIIVGNDRKMLLPELVQQYMRERAQDGRSRAVLCPAIREATAPVPFSRYKMAATISAPIAPSRWHGAEAVLPRLPRRWRWPAVLLLMGHARWF